MALPSYFVLALRSSLSVALSNRSSQDQRHHPQLAPGEMERPEAEWPDLPYRASDEPHSAARVRPHLPKSKAGPKPSIPRHEGPSLCLTATLHPAEIYRSAGRCDW